MNDQEYNELNLTEYQKGKRDTWAWVDLRIAEVITWGYTLGEDIGLKIEKKILDLELK